MPIGFSTLEGPLLSSTFMHSPMSHVSQKMPEAVASTASTVYGPVISRDN